MYPNLKILEMSVQGRMITLAVRIKTQMDIRVRSPKVRIVFRSGEQIRRLPMLIESIQATQNMNECIIYAKYQYSVPDVFLPFDPNRMITFSFDLHYGKDYYENVEFNLSRDIKLENEFYNIIIEEDNKHFSLLSNQFINEKANGNKKLKLIKKVLSKCYSAFLFLFSVCLTPFYVIDAVAAKAGITDKNKQNQAKGLKWFLSHIRWRFCTIYKKNISLRQFREWYLLHTFRKYSKEKVQMNRVTFLSSRRTDMTGNQAFVYNKIKDNQDLEIRILLDPSPFGKMKLSNIKRLSYLCATSRVLLIDDFFPILNKYELREQTKLIQLWHACGAFKTFGFTRLGKKGGPTQQSKNHRNYDYAIVSSQEIAKFYAEGFGIDEDKVIATGVPRTDIFFDDSYKTRVVDEFYTNYPELREKKILLFAPTFRGNGKESAYYPLNRFDAVQVYEALNAEYAILVKHHPFVKNASVIPEEYKDYIINMSDQSEINDLLFVADLVVTDYSSLVFEASLLDIPMLFYAYDLNRYIATRDFYYEYELFVPGKIVLSQASLITAIKNKDFEQEKIETFKHQFFDELDGKSTDRVLEMIYQIVRDEPV